MHCRPRPVKKARVEERVTRFRGKANSALLGIVLPDWIVGAQRFSYRPDLSCEGRESLPRHRDDQPGRGRSRGRLHHRVSRRPAPGPDPAWSGRLQEPAPTMNLVEGGAWCAWLMVASVRSGSSVPLQAPAAQNLRAPRASSTFTKEARQRAGYEASPANSVKSGRQHGAWPPLGCTVGSVEPLRGTLFKRWITRH
jgi:hypothetical protein